MNDRETTVNQLKDLVAGFIREREWERYHSPKNLSMSIAIEAAEIMEMFQWLDLATAKEKVDSDPAFRQHLCEELADVTAYVLSLCQQNGIDLAAALEDKMVKNRKKYPVDQVRGLDYEKPA